MREAEEDRSGPPAGKVAFARAGEDVLKQAAEKKFFGPGGEEQNCDGKEWKGAPRVPLRCELNEVHTSAKRDGDGAEDEEAAEHVESPAPAPADVVSDARDCADEDK